MQRAHRTQEYSGHEDEWLELWEFGGILSPSKDEPDHLWQAIDASGEPYDHAHDEGDGARVLEDEAVQAFRQSAKDVRQVMQVSNHSSKWHHISENVTEIQRDSRDVMQEHFFKVIDTFIQEEMLQ